MTSPQKLDPKPMPPPKTTKDLEDSIAMPPPPAPAKEREILLDPEMNALGECFKRSVIQTGLLYKFYGAAKTHGVHNVQPPTSIIKTLRTEFVKYDQLCDTIDSKILRAIAVLQHELTKEEKRIEDEQAALKAEKEREMASSTAMETDNTTSSREVREEPTLAALPSSSPISGVSARRASTISFSSLHRPSFPHKLDLSSASFKMSSSADDNSAFGSNLPSPVTLAPKSARPLGPNELLPDFIAAFGNEGDGQGTHIDLTLDDVINEATQTAPNAMIDLTAGDSSDKPIELDLDIDMDVSSMTDLFGDDPDSATAPDGIKGEGMFPTELVGKEGESASKETDFFNVGPQNFFNLIPENTQGQQAGSSKDPVPPQANMYAPSESLLANFTASTGNQNADTSNVPATGDQQAFNFDTIDLTNLGSDFFSNAQSSDMNFPTDFAMGDAATEAKNSNSGNGTSTS